MTIFATTTSAVAQFISVLLIFIFVLVITAFATKLVGDFQKGKMQGSNVTVVETERIAPNKYIQIVRICDRYYAIAVCKDMVTTISEIPEESIKFPEDSVEKISFKEFLNRAKTDQEKKD